MDQLERVPQTRIDLTASDTSYSIKADIPGVRKEDLDVRIEGNQVTIGAEVKKEREEKKNGRVLRSERQYGYASRSFSLPSSLDDAKAEAKYENGVLELTIPKKGSGNGRKLSVHLTAWVAPRASVRPRARLQFRPRSDSGWRLSSGPAIASLRRLARPGHRPSRGSCGQRP